MLKDIENKFTELIKATEVMKIDYKAEQYNLDDDYSKSKFIKDILCIANAPGSDGYILLGVKSEKGKPRKVIGISKHYDSSDLEQIVNSKIETPIQFDYFSLKYKGLDCAIVYIPKSKWRPHWLKEDYKGLKKHIFYTRRASGNREATVQEIRDMFIETLRVSEVATRKMKVSPHVVDELADMSLEDRKSAMFDNLRRASKKIGLKKYKLLKYKSISGLSSICVIINSPNSQAIHEYAVFMYPWNVKGEQVIYSRREIINGISEKPRSEYGFKISKDDRNRLTNCSLVHISYRRIYTRALENRPYLSFGYSFANKWNELWGTIIKWEYKEWKSEIRKVKYEFFIQDVSSEADLKDRIEKLLLWVRDKIEN